MKKILLIVVGIVVIAAVATPGILGDKIEGQIKTVVEGYNNVPGYSLEIVEYEKNYFNSKVALVLKYSLPGLEEAIPSEFLEVLSNEGIPIDMDISHGPIVLSPTMTIASGVAKTSIPDDAKIAELIGKYVDVEADSDFDTVVFGLTGGAKSSSVINKITFKDPNSVVDFVVSDISTNMVMDNIRLIDGYPFSDGVSDIAIGGISVKFKEGPEGKPVSVDFSGLKVIAGAVSSGETIDVNYNVGVDSFTNKGLPESPLAGKSVTGVVFDFTLENISESVFVELMKMSADPSFMDDPASGTKMQELASGLLKSGPVFSIDKMKFAVDGAEFDGNFSLSFDASKVGDIAKLVHPMMAIPALNANLELAFDESLLELGKAGVPSWSRDSMSKEEIAQFEKEEDQALNMQKEMMIQQGFFEKDGDKFITAVQFKDSKLLVNGKEQALPLF